MSDMIKGFVPPDLEEDEAHIIRRLGWAVVLQWSSLSQDARERLREQAVFTEDDHVTVQLNEQIKDFIKRHKGDNR
ncbi:hypothetical protein [Mesorhizobium sp.]|uniref:hypothetical protein n=1 Tax=Mesorhizobium sp. TaxID=1871066 RepID=UPI000FE7DB6F|nr:hypothetical protein [Mesorhizobium sp.]RWE99953.1 MAG: hypothetical protein EOS43_13655 [Mesorhizobium sp.]